MHISRNMSICIRVWILLFWLRWGLLFPICHRHYVVWACIGNCYSIHHHSPPRFNSCVLAHLRLHCNHCNHHTSVGKAIRIFDKTEAILRKWKLKMTLAVRGNRRYYFKKIKSLRPCSIYAGLGDVLFFSLRRSTKTTYYGLMVYYVINTLISVPESFILRS
jgi:hypothetical protein